MRLSHILSNFFRYGNYYSAGLMLVYAIVLLPVIAGYWKIFEKAGYPGWMSIVPVYGTTMFLKIIGKPQWWVITCGVPVVATMIVFWGVNALSAGTLRTLLALSRMYGTGIYGTLWVFNIANYFFIAWRVWATNMLSKSFGKGEGFTAGLIVLPFIFIPILGFGKAAYMGPYGDKEAFAAYQNTEEERFDFEQNKFS